jgi:hypothetical protein
LACPFFMPIEKLDGGWLHPSRLPLGAGWHGHCSAPGHEGVQPSEHELHEFCNLGYAAKCARLLLWFVCETGHRPTKHGTLEYDVDRKEWMSSHSDPRIQKMVECYVETYLQRRILSAATPSLVSENS